MPARLLCVHAACGTFATKRHEAYAHVTPQVSTLCAALQGINMPARSTVFVEDSVFLNPMTYQQMAGRAGRRGFDLSGNVIFLGFGIERIAALAAARIPGAHGNAVMTLPFALTVADMLNAGDSSYTATAAAGVRALLNTPLAAAAGHAQLAPLLAHYTAFALSLLRSRCLLNSSLAPTGLAPLVQRLQYYPNAAALSLVDLLQTGALASVTQVQNWQALLKLAGFAHAVIRRLHVR